MEMTITGRHLDVTDAIREYAQGKVAKLPRYYDRVTAIELIADRTDHNQHFEVELIVKVERADPFVGKVVGQDLYACIDEAVDKLERQLTDHKEKRRNRKHQPPRPS